MQVTLADDVVPLLVRVVPQRHESAAGYLMRTAEANGLTGPGAICELITGSTTQMPSADQIVALAHLCRCSVGEIGQLFGFTWRARSGNRALQLGSELITKDAFIRARKPAVCPACLVVNPCIRGIWDLAFYVVCATHRTVLIDRCPDCGRKLKWNRRVTDACGCGTLLCKATPESGSNAAWLVSQLLELRIDPTQRIDLPDQTMHRVVDRLSGLSLDGLLRTIWLLGHCVADYRSCGSGHGRAVPTIQEASSIIGRAIYILNDWPRSFESFMHSQAIRRPPSSRTSLESHLYGPIKTYLESTADAPELSFLRCAYEQFVRQTWKKLGKDRVLRAMERQLSLDLGDSGEISPPNGD